MEELIGDIKKGSEKAIARAITMVENDTRRGFSLLKRLYKTTAISYTVGITGPPGSGKSTLVEAAVKLWRKEGLRVGIIAVDPTSQFSGGALLGDRIRMDDLTADRAVFIRSMATRGSLGGLNSSIFDTILILSAAGYDRIVIETVGVGQTEMDIVNLADTILVVVTPESGDEIQTFKAGVMEAGDLFIVNKADRPGADKMGLLLRQMLEMSGPEEKDWLPPVITTTASRGKGIKKLMTKIKEHVSYLSGSLLERRRKRALRQQIITLLERRLREIYIEPFLQGNNNDDCLKDKMSAIYSREIDPYSLVEELIEGGCKLR